MNTEFFRKIGNTRVMSLQWVQLIRTGALFLISIFLTKIYEDTTVIADYETLMLIGTSFTFFWVSGLLTNFLPYYNDSSEKNKNIVISTSFLILFILSLFTFLALIVLGNAFFPGLNQRLLMLFAVYILFNSPSFLIEYLLLVRNSEKQLFWYSSIVFCLQVVVFCIPLALGYSLDYAIIAWIILSLVKFIFLCFLIYQKSALRFDRQIASHYIKKSMPILLSLLVGGGAEFIDGFIVKYYSSNKDFALFRYGARELPLTRILANAMSVVISGEIAATNYKGNIHEGLESLRRSSSRLIKVLFPLTIILMLSSTWLFGVLYNEQFIPASQIFNVYLLLTVSRLVFPQTVILGLQQNKVILKASLAEIVLHVSLSFILIQFYGVMGIAWAALLGEYLYKIWIVADLRRKGFLLKQYSPLVLWSVLSSILWLTYFCIAFL